ncbi:MAG: nucleotide sugar dehydrogenase [Trueperaceae bacterium]|nr:nucleotide sugar dehydrogenase [Trueperaceae bacterium]
MAVIGQGYVGLPVTLAFGEVFPGTVGFDIDEAKIARLRAHDDPTGEADPEELRRTGVRFTADPAELVGKSFFVVAVPTPIDAERRPDFRPLVSACRTVGKALRPGAVVVFESTVYPGATEEICGPELERVSGLKCGVDFTLGYSPERINPGDKEHTLKRIVKVVAGQDAPTLDRVAAVYEAIIEAGVHRASTIKVAEAAKVIENTQRDLNIALMNELAIIFDRLDINTLEVLEAAGTKWNFLPFRPGLVGGHCIGVDPYYLTSKAESVGYNPEVILAGRRINDEMGQYVARRLVKMLARAGTNVPRAKVAILGLTFKENVPDIRNSRVPDIITELADYGITTIVHDPLAVAGEAMHEYGVALSGWEDVKDLDGLVLAVPHAAYMEDVKKRLGSLVRPGGVVVDVKSAIPAAAVPDGVAYWSL